MTSGKYTPPSQQTGENSKASRGQRTGKNPRAERTQQTDENPIAIRIQRMGANPRAKVARSHTPASIGARGRTRSVRLNQNGDRSSSSNIFKRLGQEADLRDTLNRRREQERS